MAKTADEVQKSIKDRFYKQTGKTYIEGSAIDMFSYAVSKEFEASYDIIDNNKNPHIFSKLTGQDLDDTGFMLNIPREVNESDTNYFYRLMNWTLSNEASNNTAIQNALLNLTYASNAKYVPMTKGVGTGSVYIIPTSYTDDIKTKAIAEVKEKTNTKVTEGLNIDYIIPDLKAVKLMIYIESKTGDIDTIKSTISTKMATYINGIAPGDYLSIGEINKIGVNTSLVTYFNVVAMYINDIEITETEVMQEVETKLIFNSVEWVSNS